MKTNTFKPPSPINNTYFLRLCALLAVKSIVILLFILYGDVGLGPDEAQYWTWSRTLDWGYYSKPPGIAWQIWLGTQLFGNTELGVRVFSIVLSILLSLAVYFLAIACRTKERTAFWAAACMALTPLGIMGSFLAITDGGLTFFWTCASIVMARSLSLREAPNYYLMGFFILCGALFKWPIYLFWGVVLLCMPWYQQLAVKQFWMGVLISLCGLLPSLYWNVTHEWATFRHVAATVAGGHGEEIGTTGLIRGNVVEFWGAQAALISPVLFLLLLGSFIYLARQRRNISAPLFFCGGSCLLLFLAYSVLALFQKMQGNWMAFAYPPGLVFLAWYACEMDRKLTIWVKIGLAVSVALSAVVMAIPYVQSHSLFKTAPVPYRFNLFRHNVGWTELDSLIEGVGYDPKEHFLFGDKYQMSSILSFYGPQQKRAYFFNLHGTRKNQFSFWPSMAEQQLGKTGFFVAVENAPHLEKNLATWSGNYEKELKYHFKEVHFLGLFPLFEAYGNMKKGALIFKCIEYSGTQPDDTNLY